MKRRQRLRRTSPLRQTPLVGATPSQRAARLSRKPIQRRRAQSSREEREARAVVRTRSAGRCEGCGEAGPTEWAHRKAQAKQAMLDLDRREADLLRDLAIDGLETAAARAFLERIPSVAELVPSKRLREIESSFDEAVK